MDIKYKDYKMEIVVRDNDGSEVIRHISYRNDLINKALKGLGINAIMKNGDIASITINPEKA